MVTPGLDFVGFGEEGEDDAPPEEPRRECDDESCDWKTTGHRRVSRPMGFTLYDLVKCRYCGRRGTGMVYDRLVVPDEEDLELD